MWKLKRQGKGKCMDSIPEVDSENLLQVDPSTGEVLGDDATLISSGSVVRLLMPDRTPWNSVETVGQTPGGLATRGIIRGRSKASRRRFQQTMGRVDLSQVKGVLLITLTWAAVPEHSYMGRCLDCFIKWIMRRFRDVPVAWAKERGTKEGRWHFHLVIFAQDYVNCKAYQASWNRIAGSYAGNVDVKFKQDASVVRYLAKYLSKEVGVWQDKGEPEPDAQADALSADAAAAPVAVDLDTAHISPRETHTGRTWGWRFYERLALCPVKRLKISVKVAHQVRRTLAKAHRAELKARFDRWRAWAWAAFCLEHGKECPGVSLPGWIKTTSRRMHSTPRLYCDKKCEEAGRELYRFERYGSHLARGGYDRRGWSFFTVGDGSPLMERLSAYFEGTS